MLAWLPCRSSKQQPQGLCQALGVQCSSGLHHWQGGSGQRACGVPLRAGRGTACTHVSVHLAAPQHPWQQCRQLPGRHASAPIPCHILHHFHTLCHSQPVTLLLAGWGQYQRLPGEDLCPDPAVKEPGVLPRDAGPHPAGGGPPEAGGPLRPTASTAVAGWAPCYCQRCCCRVGPLLLPALLLQGGPTATARAAVAGLRHWAGGPTQLPHPVAACSLAPWQQALSLCAVDCNSLPCPLPAGHRGAELDTQQADVGGCGPADP